MANIFSLFPSKFYLPSIFIFSNALLLVLLLSTSCSASVLPLTIKATPFQTGLLLGQSSGRNLPEVEDQFGQEQQEQTAAREEVFPNWGCQQQLVQSVQAQLDEHSPIDFAGNLLAQILPKREQICLIFSSISGNLNNCLGRRPGPIHPLFLLLQTVCHQFAETLEAHGQCVAELNLTKLEGQCAQACHRHAESQLPQLRANANSQKVGKLSKSSASPSSSSLGSEVLCQLAFCAVNCFGSQISECAEEEAAEGTAGQGRTTSDPAVLKAMFSQISGLQMLLGLQQSQTPLQAQMQLLQGQVPSECAQLIGKAVTSANFIAEHDEMPGGASIGMAAASSDGLQESVPNEQQQYEGRE